MTDDRLLRVVTALLMSFVMAFFFSGFFTVVRVGLDHGWAGQWARSFCLGWPVGFTMAYFVGDPLRKVAAGITEKLVDAGDAARRTASRRWWVRRLPPIVA